MIFEKQNHTHRVDPGYLKAVAASLKRDSQAYIDIAEIVTKLENLVPIFEKFDELGAVSDAYDIATCSDQCNVVPDTGNPNLDRFAMIALQPNPNGDEDDDLEELDA